MQYVHPNYYERFSCVKGACRHSCCIGWEIDVDEETLSRYDAETGTLGARFNAAVVRDETPHFRLSDGERCPFLNGDGLCDLILERGDELLCEICREHPRFHNALPGRVESGLGLCCEEAARLILGQKEKAVLVGLDGTPCGDAILRLRDDCIALLQNRSEAVEARARRLLTLVGAEAVVFDARAWAELLLSLERLDDAWTELLLLLKEKGGAVSFARFDAFMRPRETEYEQLLVYLIYRYFANSFDGREAAETARFAVFSYELLRAMGALLFERDGDFNLASQVELARLFSSEIEYCEENLEAIKDFLRI